MPRRVSIGYQEFEDIIANNLPILCRQDIIYQGMVGEKRLCHIDYSSETFWEDTDNEYDREFFFYNT